MTAFRFRSNMILAFILGVGSVADSETVYSADEMLEEVIVSGVKDPRRDSLISGGTNRSLSSDDVVAPVISTGDMVGQLAGAASNGQGGLFQSYSLRVLVGHESGPKSQAYLLSLTVEREIHSPSFQRHS